MIVPIEGKREEDLEQDRGNDIRAGESSKGGASGLVQHWITELGR